MDENKIELVLDDIDIDDLVEFEESDQSSVKFVRDFLGRFVGDGNGAVLDKKQGIEKIGKIKLREIPALIATFRDQVDAITDEAVNPPEEAHSEQQS